MIQKLTLYFTKPYLKRYLLYILAMILLGTSVTLIQSTSAGMSAWDALNRNFYEGVPIQYRYLTPIVALILVGLAYLIEWKKPSVVMIIPIFISFFIGLIIDIELLFIPNVIGLSIIYTIIYLIIAIILVAIGLNLIIYCDFFLPALDQFCMALSKRLHISFGKGKYIGELIAFIGTVIVGLYYQSQDEYFYLGFTTIYYILFLGIVIDFVRNPLFRFLRGVPTIELFADDLLTQDIIDNDIRQSSRAIIQKEDKILIIYMKTKDIYILPGGRRVAKESLESCLRREVLEKTGYKISVHEEKVMINEYFLNHTYENHYFIASLKNKKPDTKKINVTDAEEASNMVPMWIEKNELIDRLNNHETKDQFGPQVMWREFLGIVNSI